MKKLFSIILMTMMLCTMGYAEEADSNQKGNLPTAQVRGNLFHSKGARPIMTFNSKQSLSYNKMDITLFSTNGMNRIGLIEKGIGKLAKDYYNKDRRY